MQHAVEQLLAELQASERDKFAAYGWLPPPFVKRRGQRYHYFRLVRIGNAFPAGATIRRLDRQCTKLFTRVRAGRGRGFPSLLVRGFIVFHDVSSGGVGALLRKNTTRIAKPSRFARLFAITRAWSSGVSVQ